MNLEHMLADVSQLGPMPERTAAQRPKRKPPQTLDKLACFNDNYIVFGLRGVKMPQITDIYLDKEEDMLEREQIIKFQ